jgi:ABC-type transporter Mla subunit MlaD
MNPHLDGFSLFLLGSIAVLSVAQGLLLAGAAWSAFRAVRRAEQTAGRVGVALRPAVHELARAADDAAQASDAIAAQAQRLDALMSDIVDRVERAQRALRQVAPLAARFAAAANVLSMVRSGYRAVRRLR